MATNYKVQQLTITSEVSTKDSFQMLDRMRKDRKLCDVILIAENVEIPAHKCVLASCSPYFYSMFVNSACKTEERVKMDVNPKMLLLMINYMYTSQLTVSEQTLKDILEIAKLLLLNNVQIECCNFLRHVINSSNSFYVKTLALTYGDSELLTEISSFIDTNFIDITTSDEFLNLTNEEVKELICKDSLNIPSEEKIYECVMRWIRHDLKGRRKYVRYLIGCVRLQFISKKYLSEHVANDPLLAGDTYCKDLIIKALLENEVANSLELKHRKYTKESQVMLVIGGKTKESQNTMEFYDFEKRCWSETLKIPFSIWDAKVEVIDRMVYLIGGTRNDEIVQTVSCYNLALNSWFNIGDMIEKRRGHGVAKLNNSIYVFGGFNNRGWLHSAEKYCLDDKKWISVKRMIRNRTEFGTCVVNEIAYVVGGYASGIPSNLVESYDYQLNTWRILCSMKERRVGLGLCVLDGMIYAIGGWNRNGGTLQSVERYNPEINSWVKITPMNQVRCFVDVAIKDNNIYVVGGYQLETSTRMNSIEIYNVKTDTWTLLPKQMNITRSNHCVAMLNLINT